MVDILFLAAQPNDGDGFVPVAAGSLASVSGRNLMVLAYAAIFVVLIVYAASLLWREKKIAKEIRELEQRPAKD